MIAPDDLDRRLGAWFGDDAAQAISQERLARILETTRTRPPRPRLVAGLGSHWIGGGTRGALDGRATLRSALIIALAALALMGAAILVGRWRATPQVSIPPTSNDEFVRLAALSRPMARPQVVPLLDGRVLVIGNGGEGGDPTVTGELYDPATGTSDPIGGIATPGGFVDSALRLDDGRVLIFADGTAQIFDPTTMQVGPVGPMVTPRRSDAVLLRDGRVLVAGGITPGGGVKTGLVSAELFDPDTLTFSATGSTGTAPGRLTALPDGRVFVAPDGGDVAQVYDPATGSFSTAGRMIPPFGVNGAVSLPDGRVVVFGSAGIKVQSYSEIWDPVSLTFSTAEGPPGQVLSATLLADGRVLLIGFCIDRPTGAGGGPRWTGLFDPATRVMTAGPRTSACEPSIARLPDGRVLLVGGLSDPGSYLAPDGGMHETPAVPTVEVFR